MPDLLIWPTAPDDMLAPLGCRSSMPPRSSAAEGPEEAVIPRREGAGAADQGIPSNTLGPLVGGKIRFNSDKRGGSIWTNRLSNFLDE